jgi:hypothetical protein
MHRLLQNVLTLVVLSLGGNAQAQNEPTFRLVMVSGDLMTMVSALGDESSQSKYRTMTVQKLRVVQEAKTRMLTAQTYAVDCAEPRSVTVLSVAINQAVEEKDQDRWVTAKLQGVPEQFKLEELVYVPIGKWEADVYRDQVANGITPFAPNEAVASADFVCRSIGMSALSQDALAGEIRRTGGLTDVKELACAFSLPDGTHFNAGVGFSEAKRFVRFNGRWMRGAFVRESELGFSAQDRRLSISRGTGAMTMSIGATTSAGVCDVASAQPKKF